MPITSRDPPARSVLGGRGPFDPLEERGRLHHQRSGEQIDDVDEHPAFAVEEFVQLDLVDFASGRETLEREVGTAHVPQPSDVLSELQAGEREGTLDPPSGIGWGRLRFFDQGGPPVLVGLPVGGDVADALQLRGEGPDALLGPQERLACRHLRHLADLAERLLHRIGPRLGGRQRGGGELQPDGLIEVTQILTVRSDPGALVARAIADGPERALRERRDEEDGSPLLGVPVPLAPLTTGLGPGAPVDDGA
jgi:hypothetical protein